MINIKNPLAIRTHRQTHTHERTHTLCHTSERERKGGERRESERRNYMKIGHNQGLCNMALELKLRKIVGSEIYQKFGGHL